LLFSETKIPSKPFLASSFSTVSMYNTRSPPFSSIIIHLSMLEIPHEAVIQEFDKVLLNARQPVMATPSLY
jgi:hypothetical protein